MKQLIALQRAHDALEREMLQPHKMEALLAKIARYRELKLQLKAVAA